MTPDCEDRHWESVGFQGTDPSTDFRDMGVFALLQMLSLVTGTALSAMRNILAASRHAVKGFPLAPVCINIRSPPPPSPPSRTIRASSARMMPLASPSARVTCDSSFAALNPGDAANFVCKRCEQGEFFAP